MLAGQDTIFFERGIMKLPEKLQHRIKVQGDYVEI
jgi:hypothetical protein